MFVALLKSYSQMHQGNKVIVKDLWGGFYQK